MAETTKTLDQTNKILDAIDYLRFNALDEIKTIGINPAHTELKSLNHLSYQGWSFLDIALLRGDIKLISIFHGKSSVPLLNPSMRYQNIIRKLLTQKKPNPLPVYYCMSMFKNDDLGQALSKFGLESEQDKALCQTISALHEAQHNMITQKNSDAILGAFDAKNWVLSMSCFIKTPELLETLIHHDVFAKYQTNFNHEQQLLEALPPPEPPKANKKTLFNFSLSQTMMGLLIIFFARSIYITYIQASKNNDLGSLPHNP